MRKNPYSQSSGDLLGHYPSWRRVGTADGPALLSFLFGRAVEDCASKKLWGWWSGTRDAETRSRCGLRFGSNVKNIYFIPWSSARKVACARGVAPVLIRGAKPQSRSSHRYGESATVTLTPGWRSAGFYQEIPRVTKAVTRQGSGVPAARPSRPAAAGGTGHRQARGDGPSRRTIFGEGAARPDARAPRPAGVRSGSARPAVGASLPAGLAAASSDERVAGGQLRQAGAARAACVSRALSGHL